MSALSTPADLITPRRAARIVGVHISAIYRYVLKGKLRGWRRAGSRYLVSEAEVRALIQPVVVEVEEEIRTRAEEKDAAQASLERLRRAGYRV